MDRSVQYYFIDICKSKNKIDFKMIITLQKNTILHLNADWMTGYTIKELRSKIHVC